MNEWMIIALLFVPLAAIAVSLVVWTVKNGISPMPTSPKVKASLFTLLPDELHGKIYELGSGWGTLIFPLAKKYPHCQVIGFETSPLPFWFSWIWLKISRLAHVSVVKKDFFSVNLADASLVVCYLYPGAMEKLKAKFTAELTSGTIVISNTFAIPGWIPEKVLDADDLYHSKIYLYRI